MTYSDGLKPISSHVLHHFDDEINRLRQQVRELSEEVLFLWRLNREALIDGNLQLASDVLTKLVNSKRIQAEIEHEVIALLAKEQPVACDLRLIVSIIRIAYELNSINEVSHEMAKLILALYVPHHGAPNVSLIVDVADLDLLLYRTLSSLIEAMNNFDATSINQVYDNISRLEASVQGGVLKIMDLIHANQNQIGQALTILNMMKNLESCCRCCKNFAEYCAYMIDGINLKH